MNYTNLLSEEDIDNIRNSMDIKIYFNKYDKLILNVNLKVANRDIGFEQNVDNIIEKKYLNIE